ncbi:MAG TPA: PHP domain-containing protein [Verrucomicrobiae bacterium]
MGRVRAAKSETRKAAFSDGQPGPQRRLINELPLTNRHIAELLVLQGEKEEGYKRKAYFRAAHSAFIWPEEAAFILEQNRSLTELGGIGPSLAKIVARWIENPPDPITPPPLRQNFLTLTEARQVIDSHPGWRTDLKGDLQMHTTWSDGAGSVRDMAEAALGRGYEYIAITDHTAGLKIANGIDETELAKQASEIDALNAEFAATKTRFRVLKSVELNLSPTGEGDLDCDFLDRLDIVLGSFHSQLRVKEDQTARYLAALENPCVQILGHPRGRVYNFRLGLKADWARVFARAAALDKAVEIDAYSDRQDLDVELLQIARQEGVRISFGSDSHHPWQLLFLDLALGAAILAGIPRERVINFMPADELLAWVKSVRNGSARVRRTART